MRAKKGPVDFTLLVIIIFLLCFGLVMLYSASSYNAQIKFGSSIWFLKKQALSTVVGIIAMFIVTIIPYQIWKKFALIAYGLAIVFILLTHSPLGIEVNGAKRWVGIGQRLSFQPAEFAKIAVIIFLAYIICKNRKQISDFKTVIKMLAFAGVLAVLIAVMTSNLSSAIIIFGIAYVMVFVASPKYLQFVLLALAVVLIAVLFIAFVSYRADRVAAWLDPEKYYLDGGFQVLQALYAIGSGGLFGKGLGNSIQKLGFVPEAQNDMIFTIICEELGLFGAICVIVLFIFLVWRFIKIAQNSRDMFGSLVVTGVMAHISLQVILNIAVVTNSIPNTGITLPFISYGGTSVLFLLAEMGLVLSVSRQMQQEEIAVDDGR